MLEDKKEILKIHYNETLTKISSSNLKVYNLKTVRNLIYHFDEIEDKSKQFVYDELFNYLSFIRDLKIGDSGKEAKMQSHELYSTFISPLIKFYLPLGFRANFSWLVLLFIGIFSAPILLILNCSLIWYILTYSTLLLLRLKSYMEQRNYKIYGPLY